MRIEGAEGEVCGRAVEAERIGASAPVLCAAHAGAASPHPERAREIDPREWEAWR